MALAIYYVMRGEDGWVIRFEDREYGHNTLTSAMRASIAAARASAENGHEVQILVQWPDGAWVVSWTSEDNFRPDAPAPWVKDGAGPQSVS
jgi:hypothetical protein